MTVLYNTYIRSKLEYASIIWAPIYQCYKDRIEHIQRKFLKCLSFKCDGIYPPRGHDHQALLNRFTFLSLENRRIYASQMFLFKLVNALIDCPDLLAQIRFYAPQYYSRQQPVFYIPAVNTNFESRNPVQRACRLFNQINPSINTDINDTSLSCFKKMLLNYFMQLNM